MIPPNTSATIARQTTTSASVNAAMPLFENFLGGSDCFFETAAAFRAVRRAAYFVRIKNRLRKMALLACTSSTVQRATRQQFDCHDVLSALLNTYGRDRTRLKGARSP